MQAKNAYYPSGQQFHLLRSIFKKTLYIYIKNHEQEFSGSIVLRAKKKAIIQMLTNRKLTKLCYTHTMKYCK